VEKVGFGVVEARVGFEKTAGVASGFEVGKKMKQQTLVGFGFAKMSVKKKMSIV